MNCRMMEDWIADLARESAMEENLRALLLDHAESCPRCSALLAQERALSDALRLAAEEAAEAPEHVEAALVAAYRRRIAGLSDQPAPQRLRFLPSAPRGIAAAIALALLAAASYRLIRSLPPSEIPARANLGVAAETGPRQAVEYRSMPAPPPAAEVSPRTAANSGSAGARIEPRKVSPQTPAVPIEIATDFIPLTSKADLASLESGQLLRVRLPGSSMAFFGIPVDQERLERPVTAQVLIGQDGIAHAIRFLNEPDANWVQTTAGSK